MLSKIDKSLIIMFILIVLLFFSESNSFTALRLPPAIVYVEIKWRAVKECWTSVNLALIFLRLYLIWAKVRHVNFYALEHGGFHMYRIVNKWTYSYKEWEATVLDLISTLLWWVKFINSYQLIDCIAFNPYLKFFNSCTVKNFNNKQAGFYL